MPGPKWPRSKRCTPHASIAFVTREELRDLEHEVEALLLKHEDRLVDSSKRPAGSRPVRIFVATSVDELAERGQGS